MPRIVPHRDHVPLHRLWAFTTLEDTLSLSEHAHILQCAHCADALRSCLNAESFGAVLKDLQLESARTAEERPKLRTLYIVPGPVPQRL